MAFTRGLCSEQIFPVSSCTWGCFLFHHSTRVSQPVPARGLCMYWAYLCWLSPISCQFPSHHGMGWDMRSDRCALHTTSPLLLLSQPPLPAAQRHCLTAINMDSSRAPERDGWINTEGRRQKERKSKAIQGSLLSTRTGNNLPAICTSFRFLLWMGAICVSKSLGEGSSLAF